VPDRVENDEEYITVAEGAATLKVKKPTLYRWIAQDPSVPALKINGTVRLPKARFLKWLRQHEQGQGRGRGTSVARGKVAECRSAPVDLTSTTTQAADIAALRARKAALEALIDTAYFDPALSTSLDRVIAALEART
jgi:excisionase family DNA binding protein